MIKTYIMNIQKLSESEVFGKYYQTMPLTCQKKIDNFRYQADKMRSLAAGIVLKQGLLDFGIEEDRIETAIFDCNLHGKPYLKNIPKVQFNLSHAGNYAVASFGSKELGIDIECMDRNGEKIPNRFFTKKEQIYLKSIVNKEQWKEEFIRIWTRKESFIKAIGLGLSFPLSDVETLPWKTGKIVIHEQYPLYNFYEYRIKDYWITVCGQEMEVDKKLIWVEI